MKNSIKLLLLITLCFSSMFSKAQNFLYPISEIEFQQQYQGMASRGSDEGKYRGFKMNSNGKYFSSQQVKQLALLFSGDYWRYQFAVAAYPQTADQQNFYDVYDAFTTYSAIFRLNDFLKSLPDQVYGNAQPTQPIPTDLQCHFQTAMATMGNQIVHFRLLIMILIITQEIFSI